MHSRATDRRSASKCQGKCPDQTLDQAFGLSEVLVAVSTSRLSCKSAGKTRTLMPVWDSSGESQLQSEVTTPVRGSAMCGIAGMIDWRAATPADALRSIGEAMIETVRHRGPDAGAV